MRKRSAQNDVCSSYNFPGIYWLNSTNSNDNTRFKLGLTTSDNGLMLASRLSYTIGWYSGIVVLDVVGGERVLD
jgi:hypothetical protein